VIERLASAGADVAAIVQADRPGAVEPDIAEHVRHVADASIAGCHRAGQPVDEQHVPSQPAKPEQVLQVLPGVPGLAWLLGHAPGDGDATAHGRSS
jgi:hypothetical protein